MKKDIEWLKEKVEELDKEESQNYPHYHTVPLPDVLDYIDQLDEPEVTEEQAWDIIKDIYGISNEAFVRSVVRLVMEHVKDDTTISETREKLESEALSQKWIKNNTAMAYTIAHYSEEDVPVIMVSDLKNLLVPKRELPVIPKFVAEWIEEVKKQNKSLIFAIGHIYDKNEIGESPNKEENRIFQWMESDDNEEVFARAWLDGFTIANEDEEQKYYVIDKGNTTLLRKSAVGEGVANSLATDISEVKRWKIEEEYQLTEQEIKDYDPRYWAFRKPVEELEE